GAGGGGGGWSSGSGGAGAQGLIVITYSVAACATLGTCTSAGDLGYESSLPSYKYCNGSDWIKVDGGTTVENAGSSGPVTVFLTSGSSWTVPSDWNASNNTIEVIGGG